MRKLLYIDLISPAGHENYDSNMIRLMNKFFIVDVRASEGMTHLIPTKYCHTIESCPNKIYPEYWKHSKYRSLSKLLWRYYQYEYIKKIVKENSNDYDCIFFSSIEVFSFMLATRGFKGTNVYFVDHGVYRIKNRLTRFFYRAILSPSVNIVALEEYIREYLINNGIKSNIYVIHHPIPEYPPIVWSQLETKTCYDVFAPSSSNEDSFVADLIESREKLPENVKIIIRAHRYIHRDEHLDVYNERISSQEYDERFRNADFILIPYESAYNYRTSAILFESLGMGKRVLLWGNNTLKEYFRDYKNCVCVYSNTTDFIRKISKLDNLEYDITSINRFMSNYSDCYIQEQIKKAFYRILL